MKSSGSPGISLCRVRSTSVMASATGLVSGVAAETVMLLMCCWPCSFFITVVYGREDHVILVLTHRRLTLARSSRRSP